MASESAPPTSRPTRIRLRHWQSVALDKFWASEKPNFLAVATPGAGKTTFALAAAVQHLMDEPSAPVVVVTPTSHLKAQWSSAASALRLHLDPDWSPRDGAVAADMHGIVVTYQQVSSSASALRKVSSGAFVILDEVHHAGDDRSWGTALLTAFSGAERRLSLSGTPFRSDSSAIPFVDYHLDEAHADFEYGYSDALSDRAVVRPVYFPRVGGYMEWVAPDGEEHSATFSDDLGREKANQRLRTALSLDGQWLPEVLRQADERLQAMRIKHPAAGGLVVAGDQDHARGIGDLLRRAGREVVVATSDDPGASHRIADFAKGDQPWIVAVRMVSEGVDIPRLRLAVLATTITTELFFRQVVGRVVRWTRGEGVQKAYVFVPDDPRLRRYSSTLSESRRHYLKSRTGSRHDEFAAGGDTGFDSTPGTGREEQLTMFEVIGSVATGSEETAPADALGVFSDSHDQVPNLAAVNEGAGVDLMLAPPTLAARRGTGSAGSATMGDSSEPGESRSATKARLRGANSAIVKALVESTDQGHSAVNRELNRLSGINKVSTATVAELEVRLVAGRTWLRSC